MNGSCRTFSLLFTGLKMGHLENRKKRWNIADIKQPFFIKCYQNDGSMSHHLTLVTSDRENRQRDNF